MARFTSDQIEHALDAKSARLSPQDIRRIAQSKASVMKMIDEFPPAWEKAKRQATLLFQLIEASATGKTNIHPEDLRSAAGALIYLGEALDIVPDDEDDGYDDDAAIVSLGIKRSEVHVRAYCESAGLNVAEYLD